MTSRVNIQLGDVQKTLFLPLWGRAEESQKAKPMLIDETAVRIIGQVDYDFTPMTCNLEEISQIAWIQRSLICDRVIRRFLAEYPTGTVVNIGCGLDTTFERVDNGRLRWYDLDLPDVIKLRRSFIRESSRRTFISASFLEKGWFTDIEVSGNVFFMAAGVFYYFQEAQIREFILRLADAYPGCEILFDVCSPIGMRVANKKVVESSGLDERSHLVWGLEDKKDILAWDPRIRLAGTYHYFRKPQQGLRNTLMGWLSDLMGIQYMVHLRLGEPG